MNIRNFKPLSLLAIAAVVVTLWSCSKDEMISPVTADEEQLQAGEIVAKEPAPGFYTITKFIDTGGDETAQFNGYVFEFQADGDFIATTNTGAVHTGFWDLNSAETMMELFITGNQALDDLDDDDWKVNRITNIKIKISTADPDVVVFTKI